MKRKLNKKSLYQEGGAMSSTNPDDNSMALAKGISEQMEMGVPAINIYKDLISQYISQDEIDEAFQQLGYSPQDIDELSNEVAKIINSEIQQSDLDSDIPEAQYGGYVDAPDYYLPENLGQKGNVFGAAMFAGKALKDLFGGKDQDGDGFKDGAFRQLGKKQEAFKNFKNQGLQSFIPNKMTNKEFEVNMDADMQTSLSGVSNYLKQARQQERADALIKEPDFKYGGSLPKAQQGVQLPLGLKGQLFSNIPVPNINWAKGIPELEGTENRQGVNVSGFNLSKDIKLRENLDLNLSNPAIAYTLPTLDDRPVSNVGKFTIPFQPKVGLTYKFQQGGSLAKAQVGTQVEKEKKLTFKEWVMEDPVRRGTANAKSQYQEYLDLQDSSDILYPQVQDIDPFDNVTPDMTNTFDDEIDTFDDEQPMFPKSPYLDAFGKAGNVAVAGANLANEFFQNKKASDAEKELRYSTMADKVYGAYNERPGSRGMWDVNTGLAQPDNLDVGYARMGKEVSADLEMLQKFMGGGPTGDDKLAPIQVAVANNNTTWNSGVTDIINNPSKYSRTEFINAVSYMGAQHPDANKIITRSGVSPSIAGTQYVPKDPITGALQYQQGGEFESHIMYNPETGEGYMAENMEDHLKMKEMGYLHEEEMNKAQYGREMSYTDGVRQGQGSFNPPNRKYALDPRFNKGGEVEVDNQTLAALIAAGADIEIL